MKFRQWKKGINWWKRDPYGLSPAFGKKFTKANKVYLYKTVKLDGMEVWTYTARPKVKGACMYGLRIALSDGRRVRDVNANKELD